MGLGEQHMTAAAATFAMVKAAKTLSAAVRRWSVDQSRENALVMIEAADDFDDVVRTLP